MLMVSGPLKCNHYQVLIVSQANGPRGSCWETMPATGWSLLPNVLRMIELSMVCWSVFLEQLRHYFYAEQSGWLLQFDFYQSPLGSRVSGCQRIVKQIVTAALRLRARVFAR